MTARKPRYLTPYELAVELGADPVAFRDWLKREPARGRDHTAPREYWISPGRRTYNATTATAAWKARPGRGRWARTRTTNPDS